MRSKGVAESQFLWVLLDVDFLGAVRASGVFLELVDLLEAGESVSVGQLGDQVEGVAGVLVTVEDEVDVFVHGSVEGSLGV